MPITSPWNFNDIFFKAWDQSDKFVKIYLSNLRGVHSLDSSCINLSKDGSQESLTIDNLNGKNYVFVIPKLSNPVENIAFKVSLFIPASISTMSTFYITNCSCLCWFFCVGIFQMKSDMVLLSFKKKESEKWECLTEKEKAKQASTKYVSMSK